MVCLIFNLIVFYTICKYISIQRKNWNVFYTIISLYVLFTIFFIKLWLEELIFFFIVLPRPVFYGFFFLTNILWLSFSYIVLLYTYLGWDFIYISNLLTNQWAYCLELIYNQRKHLNRQWFAYQIKKYKFNNIFQHYFGNVLIYIFFTILSLFLYGLTHTSIKFYKYLYYKCLWVYPLSIIILFSIFIFLNHFLQVRYTSLPLILFFHTFFIDKIFYKLAYSTIDLRVNNEHLSRSFLLKQNSLFNIYQIGLAYDSTINSKDFKSMTYLSHSWIGGKHYHISMCKYFRIWPIFFKIFFFKEKSFLKYYKENWEIFLKRNLFYKVQKAAIKVKRRQLNKRHHTISLQLKKKQHYHFCKQNLKKKMTKDAIKRQTIIKMRNNIKIFLYFLKQQRVKKLLESPSLTLTDFFYSVYLIEFQLYYKLHRYLSIKNIYFIFLKTSVFYYTTLFKKYYTNILYYTSYFLMFFTWKQFYNYLKYKNYNTPDTLLNDYINQENMLLFKFYFSFKLSNFFLLFAKQRPLITFSKNQTLFQKKFSLKYFQEVLQNTIFLLTFQLTNNWQVFISNLTNYLSLFFLTIFFTLKQISKQLKIKIFLKFFKINIKKKQVFGFRKQKKLPSKKINVI
jgi:hypothetical protein